VFLVLAAIWRVLAARLSSCWTVTRLRWRGCIGDLFDRGSLNITSQIGLVMQIGIMAQRTDSWIVEFRQSVAGARSGFDSAIRDAVAGCGSGP